MCAVTTPLLKLIGAYTGFDTLTLLCGGVPKDADEQLMTGLVTVGTSPGPNPRDFTNYDVEGFGDKVLGHLYTFLQGLGEVV